jgi:hypothetical protein
LIYEHYFRTRSGALELLHDFPLLLFRPMTKPAAQPTTAQSLGALLKSARDIMRKNGNGI